jgi:3-oxoacyl-[acyl-carrier protein] reductase
MQELLLSGRHAVVTGATSNIGLAITTRLAQEGAEVLAIDINPESAKLFTERSGQHGPPIHYLACDLAKPDAHELVVAETTRRFRCPSILVHSAAPTRRESDNVTTVSPEVFDEMMNVNVRTGFFVAQSFCNKMKADGVRGQVLFITSLHSGVPRNLPHYSAAKAGQTMLVKELARAFGPAGIRVNAIAPGAIPGGGVKITSDAADRISAMIPMRRVGGPEDIAATAVALLSDKFTPYVTGCTIPVDGGLGLHSWIPDPY